MTTKFTIRDMLKCGVHFGHKTNKWNPSMAQFIHGTKGNVHIIDLRKTFNLLTSTLDVIAQHAKSNNKILFVGTKKQLSSTIAKHASDAKQYYVNQRWLGGMLTNWATVSNSIKTLKETEAEIANPESNLTKKEKVYLTKKLVKLEAYLGGIKDMKGTPDLMIVFDTEKESIAIQEANKLNIPVVAIVDSNSSLEGINFPIPGNDDSAKSVSFFCEQFTQIINKTRTIAPKSVIKTETKPKTEAKAEKKAETMPKAEAKTEKKAETKK